MTRDDENWSARFGRMQPFLPAGLADALKTSHVLIAGLGAIGGAAAEVLARVGVGSFTLIDPDILSAENVASQTFAMTTTFGLRKVDVAHALIRDINPETTVREHKATTDTRDLLDLMSDIDVIVLGMDTLSGGIAFYRAAAVAKVPVIDFLYFPVPNVVSSLPGDPSPEVRFSYPTRDLPPSATDDREISAESLLRVMAYGFACNPSVYTAIGDGFLETLKMFLQLRGPSPSFAPLTMETGLLMARDAIFTIASKHGIRYTRLGWPAFYFDTYDGRVEKPRSAYLKDVDPEGVWLGKLRSLRGSLLP